MPVKKLITAFSLPKEMDIVLNNLQTKTGKSRSQILREMINFFVISTKGEKAASRQTAAKELYLDNADVNKILRLYYQLLSQTRPKPTLVVGISIINKKSRVLIGLRKSTDQHIPDLHWTFPSGKFNSLNFESEIIKTIRQETGLTARVISLVHARLIPDSPGKKIRIIGLYYHCRIISGKTVAGGDFKQLKWVEATQVNRHFTTSVADEIMNFLGTL